MMRVPLTDLGAQHAPLAGEIGEAVQSVLRLSRFSMGEHLDHFEYAARSFLGVRHAIGVSSGTDALIVALRALDIGPGHEVITTPFSFFASVESIRRCGAMPRFVDVDPATLNLDPGGLSSAVTGRTRAILPVHLFGSPVQLDAVLDVAARHGLAVVEDAAQGFGSTHLGRPAGTQGTIGCFSFFPSKILGAIGDAGLVTTNDDALAARCRRLRQHGAERKGEHVELGGNFRLDAVQAAALSVKLPHVGHWIAARRALAAAYDAAFRSLPGIAAVVRAAGWNGAVYAVRVTGGRRDAMREWLSSRGIETAVYYERPLHLQPALADLGLARGAFPVSELASAELLALPIYPEMTSAQCDHVIDAVQAFRG